MFDAVEKGLDEIAETINLMPFYAPTGQSPFAGDEMQSKVLMFLRSWAVDSLRVGAITPFGETVA